MDGKPPKMLGALFLTPLSSSAAFCIFLSKLGIVAAKSINNFTSKLLISFGIATEPKINVRSHNKLDAFMNGRLQQLSQMSCYILSKSSETTYLVSQKHMISLAPIEQAIWLTVWWKGWIGIFSRPAIFTVLSFLLNSIYEAGHLFTILHRQIH